MTKNQRELLVVGGPNGAGKSTLAEMFLTEGGWVYLGADEIAKELAPENPEAVAVQAGRQFVQRFEQHLKETNQLIVESTLSGRSMARMMERAAAAGFTCRVAFVFVDSSDVSVARVASRVRKGGHNVPEADIRRRFTRSIRNFWSSYRLLADHWVLCDNRHGEMREIAVGDRHSTDINDPEALSWFIGLATENDER